MQTLCYEECRARPAIVIARGALAIYRQISADQKADAEQIKQALITVCAADALN